MKLVKIFAAVSVFSLCFVVSGFPMPPLQTPTSCSSFLDHSLSYRRCFIFNTSDCQNPKLVFTCKVLDIRQSSPCYRFRCNPGGYLADDFFDDYGFLMYTEKPETAATAQVPRGGHPNQASQAPRGLDPNQAAPRGRDPNEAPRGSDPRVEEKDKPEDFETNESSSTTDIVISSLTGVVIVILAAALFMVLKFRCCCDRLKLLPFPYNILTPTLSSFSLQSLISSISCRRSNNGFSPSAPSAPSSHGSEFELRERRGPETFASARSSLARSSIVSSLISFRQDQEPAGLPQAPEPFSANASVAGEVGAAVGNMQQPLGNALAALSQQPMFDRMITAAARHLYRAAAEAASRNNNEADQSQQEPSVGFPEMAANCVSTVVPYFLLAAVSGALYFWNAVLRSHPYNKDTCAGQGERAHDIPVEEAGEEPVEIVVHSAEVHEAPRSGSPPAAPAVANAAATEHPAGHDETGLLTDGHEMPSARAGTPGTEKFGRRSKPSQDGQSTGSAAAPI